MRIKSNIVNFPYSRVFEKATSASFGHCLKIVSLSLEEDLRKLERIDKDLAEMQGWNKVNFKELS